MSLVLSVFAGFAVLGMLIYSVTIYNGLVGLRNEIDRAWSNIDVLLKQRNDEIPRLIDVCKGYMQYERETLQALTESRAKYAAAATPNQKALASDGVAESVQKLFATAENYPDLKANVSFLQLQTRISELESQIADRREFYNDAINLFNTRIQQVPDKWLANSMGLQPRAMFRVSPAEKSPVSVGPLRN